MAMRNPAWSPDGQKVALVSDENDFQAIYVMNPDGTGMSRLTDKDSHTIHPNWSPDSKKIIYCSSDDLHPPKKNPSEIYSVDIETKNISTCQPKTRKMPICSSNHIVLASLAYSL